MRTGLVILFLSLLAGYGTLAQSEDDYVQHILRAFLMKSQYVHKVFFQLLFAKIYEAGDTPIEEPMTFDNFTYDHAYLFQSGIAHTYNPLLYGFDQSVLTMDVNNETYTTNMHLSIPVATMTGTYDLDITEGFWESTHWQGEGAYNHSFHNVELWMKFTVDNTVDGKRAILSDVHTSLYFERCRLWAENYRQNGVPWTDARWISQSAKFKVDYHEKEEDTDILLSETVGSYFGTMWGFFRFQKEEALQMLIDIAAGTQPRMAKGKAEGLIKRYINMHQ